MEKQVTINHEQGVYVIPCDKGYTCLGFDIAYQKGITVAQFAGLELPKEEKGTLAAYEEYSRIMRDGAEFSKNNNLRCESELSPQLQGLESKRVEVVTTYGETRRFYVGKSTGWMPCHLEIAKSNSSGGPAAEKEYTSVRVIR